MISAAEGAKTAASDADENKYISYQRSVYCIVEKRKNMNR